MTSKAGTGGAVCAMPSKACLRHLYRKRRRALPPARQQRHAEALARALLPHIRAPDVVAIYLCRDGEIDPAPLLREGRAQGVAFALPVLVDDGLRFALYRRDEPMCAGRYGLSEPAQPVAVRPTLVLAPLVAFDERGNRLGMGGGYYDRYFAAHPDVNRIGVAHGCQERRRLPVAPWDVPLRAVVTERGWRRFGGGWPA